MDSANRQKSDPSVSDFHHDMNEHGRAEYRKVGDYHILELDSYPSGWRLVAWKAVKHPTEEGYAPPDGIYSVPENRYAWDAAGERHFDDRDEGLRTMKGLTASELPEWKQANPYEGPRRPYSERMEE